MGVFIRLGFYVLMMPLELLKYKLLLSTGAGALPRLTPQLWRSLSPMNEVSDGEQTVPLALRSSVTQVTQLECDKTCSHTGLSEFCPHSL